MSSTVLLLCILSTFAVAYRYYSAFLAVRVAGLDDARITPAVRMADGQNYEPTNRWVLFGHHFAAISGAGPLIGPVLAAQFGYLPGLLWIVIGVCIGGAVQDFLVMAASLRRGGRSLAQIAFEDVGKAAGVAATTAILFIVIIALAGLGKVVVKALGGEAVAYPADAAFVFPAGVKPTALDYGTDTAYGYSQLYSIPAGTEMVWAGGKSRMPFNDSFKIRLGGPASRDVSEAFWRTGQLPRGTLRLVPGSAWGTFTIAATIPIALFVGLYMYRIRPGRVVEASIIGGTLTLIATVAGGWVAQHAIGEFFNLSAMGVTWWMALYGFVAAVLPVWILLCPRDYLSSFLKIGTIILLVGGVLIANPKLEAPAVNSVFLHGGPTVRGQIFPFLFITIMCGAISGFHALVSSGTTPKMIRKESDARMIGYGAMLIEGLVAVVAMIAAATLPVRDYYAMNTELAAVPQFHDRILQVAGPGGIEEIGMYETNTRESLRGRTGGAVTLAVGMAHVFDGAARRFVPSAENAMRSMWKYWYHFAIMFEALFILTTIDAGTRIARFLLQEVMGHLHPALGLSGGWLSAAGATAFVVAAWSMFMNSDEFATVWAMFGISNQMLAVIALAIVSAYLARAGRVRYLWVTLIPLAIVFDTTTTAAVYMLQGQWAGLRQQWLNAPGTRSSSVILNASVQGGLILLILVCTLVVLAGAGMRIWKVIRSQSARVIPAAGQVAGG